MPVTRHQTITQAHMDALAAQANILMPEAASERAFEFSAFSGDVPPPTNVQATLEWRLWDGDPGYDGGDGLSNIDKQVVHVYSYKDIAGRRTYSSLYATGYVDIYTAAQLNPGKVATVNWSWTAAADVDGYVFVLKKARTTSSYVSVTTGDIKGWTYDSWKYTTTTSVVNAGLVQLHPLDGLSEDGSDGGQHSPVSDGCWRREFDRIVSSIYTGDYIESTATNFGNFTKTTDWIFSGPHVCCIGNTLRTQNVSVFPYKDIQFWFAGSTTSLMFNTAYMVGYPGADPGDWLNSESEDHQILSPNIDLTLPTAITITGKMVWRTVTSGAAWSHTGLTTSGTIVSQSVSETDKSFTLDFVITFASGAQWIHGGTVTRDGFLTDPSLGVYLLSNALNVENVATAVAAGLHPSQVVRYASVTKPTALPITVNDGFTSKTIQPSVYVGTSGIDGIWIAKTAPVYSEARFLDTYLPNYFAGIDEIRGAAVGDGIEVEPATANRPALWPVFRETDYRDMIGELGGIRQVPFWKNDIFHDFTESVVTIAAGATYSNVVDINEYEKLTISLLDSVLPVYGSKDGVPNPSVPATYDVVRAGGLDLPTDFAFPAGDYLYYTIYNNTSAEVTVRVRFKLFRAYGGYYPGHSPIFFRFDSDAPSTPGDLTYTYNTSPATTYDPSYEWNTSHKVPHAGHLIDHIIIRRAPEGTPAVAPSTGTEQLGGNDLHELAVGIMRNTTDTDDGTFVELSQFTIPAGQAQVSQSVFWPVLGGTPLVYRLSDIATVTGPNSLICLWDNVGASVSGSFEIEDAYWIGFRGTVAGAISNTDITWEITATPLPSGTPGTGNQHNDFFGVTYNPLVSKEIRQRSNYRIDYTINYNAYGSFTIPPRVVTAGIRVRYKTPNGTALQVFPLVSFMPALISDYVPSMGQYCGRHFGLDDPVKLRFRNQTTYDSGAGHWVIQPITSVAYNNLETLMALL